MDTSERAEHAQRLMDDAVLKEAFSAVLNEAIAEWLKSPPAAVDLRESLYRNVVAVDRVRGKLQTYVNDGKVAAHVAERVRRATE